LIVDGKFISLFASGADQISDPKVLLNVEIDRQNLRLVAMLIKKLELSGLTNLDQQPIELGPIGPGGIVIGAKQQSLQKMMSKFIFGKEEKPVNTGVSLHQQRLDPDWSEAALCCCCLSPGGDEEKEEQDLAPVTIALGASP
jgi:hypothetical protein